MQAPIPEMHPLFKLFIFVLLISACTSSEPKKEKKLEPVAFPEKYLLPADTMHAFDSTALNGFLVTDTVAEKHADDILDFYQRRNYSFAWFTGDTLTASVYTFYNLLQWFWETGKDSLAYNKELDSLLMNTGNAPGSFPDMRQKLRMEFLLTAQFFEYAKYQYEGRVRSDLKSLEWYIPRSKKNYRMLLDSLVAGVPDLSASEPVNRQYKLLKEFLVAYKELLLKDTVQLREINSTIAEGDSSAYILLVRKKLALRNDLIPEDTISTVYDAKLKQGIMSYQRRMGLEVNGELNNPLVRHLNTSVENQIRTILINMERLRWVPDELNENYILVNIPEYRLHVFQDSNVLFSMNVVVGKEATQTIVFNGLLSKIVFSPYWIIPQSIIVNEMLPILKRNPGYLATKNMEVLKGGKVVNPSSINWRSFHSKVPVEIRQRPGPDNSLGHIKFMFPNRFSIYLHDTPSRQLFDRTGRSYSHGCIRIEEPAKLAEFLLKEDKRWTREAIESAMYSGKETEVELKVPFPVFIGYFTAWVDAYGKLNLRKDIYGHDARLANELF